MDIKSVFVGLDTIITLKNDRASGVGHQTRGQGAAGEGEAPRAAV